MSKRPKGCLEELLQPIFILLYYLFIITIVQLVAMGIGMAIGIGIFNSPELAGVINAILFVIFLIFVSKRDKYS